MVDSNSSDIKSPAASQQQREGDSGGPPHGRPRAMMSYSCHAICCNPTSTTYDSAISNDYPSLNHPDHLRDRGRPRLFWIDNSIITLKLPLERDEILRSPQISQCLSRWPIRTARRGLRDAISFDLLRAQHALALYTPFWPCRRSFFPPSLPSAQR